MNPQSLNDHSPRRLEPIDGGLFAFVPSPLPATAIFPDRLWPLLADVKQRLGLLEGVGRSLSNPGLLLRPLQTREALQSTRYKSPPKSRPNEQVKPHGQVARTTTDDQRSRKLLQAENPPLVRVGLNRLLGILLSWFSCFTVRWSVDFYWLGGNNGS